MTKQYWLLWLKSAGIRALKTFAQTFVATIGTGAVVLGNVDWRFVLSSAALAAILSVATSITGLPEVKAEMKKTTEGEVKEEELAELEPVYEDDEDEQGK